MNKLFLKSSKTIMQILLIISSLSACSQPKDNNMNWTAKFNFFDLYKVKVDGGHFNPGSAIRIEDIKIPYENTIILAASKDEHSFDPTKKATGGIAVLFVSNNKGQSYQEIKTGEEDFEYMESKGDYSLIRAYTMDLSNNKKHYKILLLNHKTFELTKVDEYIMPEDLSDYYYSRFDGKYSVLKNNGKFTLVNVLDKDEHYDIPTDKIGNHFFNIGEGKIIYQKGNEILEYNVFTQQNRLINTLKNHYDYFFYEDDQLTLQRKILDDGEKSEYDIYDIYENFLFKETPENKYFYRYKNFVCDYRRLGVKPQIRYSYDYGKTWKIHHVQDFTILQKKVGFYKDEFLVTEAIFWHFDSEESGGRIMVGEFIK